ncbi:hypothetical protein SEMRO_723_G192970.1 [Seminavis robusta]|uniref:Uncharacterized protein n=1 Tax=Seminavis robusta TaxID=568900 RepID=A0A9N8E6S3_9STRA|nr:hypothetical protein SEMRO_723_G192970.1 [Seminavis robusta]|eukprot:Sro723_g192970.1 n/a (96) ;mRNA; f:7621-7908
MVGRTAEYHFPQAHVYMMANLFEEPMSPEFSKVSKDDPDARTLEQALVDTEHLDKWIAALEKEIRDLEPHGTWKETPIQDAKGDIVPVMAVGVDN